MLASFRSTALNTAKDYGREFNSPCRTLFFHFFQILIKQFNTQLIKASILIDDTFHY
jgi:hypothetical protein